MKNLKINSKLKFIARYTFISNANQGLKD